MKRLAKIQKSTAALALALSALTAAISLNASAKGWDAGSSNDPFTFAPDLNPFLGGMPKKAEVPTKPWSGPFWANGKGGIAYRWQTDTTPWNYTPPTKAELLAKNDDQLQAFVKTLSPAEKFDILRGDFEYRTLHSALDYIDGSGKASWRGICNGYTLAASHLIEPTPMDLTAVIDGRAVKIPFGSSDFKALASYYYEDQAVGMTGNVTGTRRLGIQCRDAKLFRPAECRKDLNAGTFHIAVTNQISMGQPIFADVWRGRQVWQHPIYAYSYDTVGERSPRGGAAPGTKREVQVKMKISMGDYTDAAWEAGQQKTKTRTLRYWLELDENDQIIGGDWVWIGSGAVDYLWYTDPVDYQGGYELLNPALMKK